MGRADRATPFAAEVPPARVVLAKSRTLRGSGAAGAAAVVSAAGVEVAQKMLAEAQDAVLPLAPYLDTLRWASIALALGGIGITVWARLDDWKRGRRRLKNLSLAPLSHEAPGGRCSGSADVHQTVIIAPNCHP